MLYLIGILCVNVMIKKRLMTITSGFGEDAHPSGETLSKCVCLMFFYGTLFLCLLSGIYLLGQYSQILVTSLGQDVQLST